MFQNLYDEDSVNNQGMVHIDTKTLPALVEKDFTDAKLKTYLELGPKDSQIWTHTKRGNGDILFPPETVSQSSFSFVCSSSINLHRLCRQAGLAA